MGAGSNQRGRAVVPRAPLGRPALGEIAMDTGAPAFTTWLETFFAAYYRRRPVNATFIGRHDYDHVLPDCSTEGLDAQLSETRTLIRSLRDLPIESLTEAEAMDRRLAEGFLEIAGWED